MARGTEMQAIYRSNIEDDDVAGAYSFYESRGRVAGMAVCCPGCAKLCALNFDANEAPAWKWNNSRGAPTLTPSVIHDPAEGGCGWHGWLIDGWWK